MAEQPAAAPLKKNVVRELVNHVATAYTLINSAGKAYAVPGRVPGSHYDGVPGIAQAFGPEMRRRIIRISRQVPEAGMISRATADTVMQHLEAMAFDEPETPLALRMHQAKPPSDRVYIDLGRADRDSWAGPRSAAALVIRPDGWELARPPDSVVFRRTHATKPLPIPSRGGRLDTLAGILALDPGGEAFAALVGWLVSLPFADSVRPGLLLVGPPGTGKSTRIRLAASLVEPSGVEALGASFGRNFGDDHVRALSRAVPLWDNLTSISGDASDALCCMITGTAREVRTLYTDNEMNTVPIMRPVGLTAVGVPAGLRPDALDRLIVIDVPVVGHRIDDAKLQQQFDVAHPQLLGALADVVAAALRWREKVEPPTQHRMAAHVRLLAAVDAAVQAGELEGCPSGLLDAYVRNHRRTQEQTAADDAFGGALINMLARHHGSWRGKASDLLIAVSMYGSPERHTGWPQSARKVPVVLAQLQDGLRALGVTWQTSIVTGSKFFTFTMTDPESS